MSDGISMQYRILELEHQLAALVAEHAALKEKLAQCERWREGTYELGYNNAVAEREAEHAALKQRIEACADSWEQRIAKREKAHPLETDETADTYGICADEIREALIGA